jgi:hypothetical protein
MEHIAKVVQKDPIEVRIKNLKQDDSNILNMIEDFKVTVGYEERKQTVEEFNKVSYGNCIFCEIICLKVIKTTDNFHSHEELLGNTYISKIWLHFMDLI